MTVTLDCHTYQESYKSTKHSYKNSVNDTRVPGIFGTEETIFGTLVYGVSLVFLQHFTDLLPKS